MKIASAKLVPHSSVVGSSVMLMDNAGKVIGQLAVLNAGGKDASIALGQQIVDIIENVPRHEAVVENLHRLR